MIHFVVPGHPVGKARARVTKKGHSYTPKPTVVYESWVRQCAVTAMDGREPLQGGIRLSVQAYFAIPQSWSKKRRQEAAQGLLRPAVKPDLDNVLKAVLDACQGVVFQDDKQVVVVWIGKHYSGFPKLEIKVGET